MAIRNRQGLYAEFDPNKLVSGEFAFPLDTKDVYYCIAPGDVRRVATKEELQQILTSSPEAFNALQVLLADLEGDVDLSTTILNDIANLQTDKLDKIGDSKDNTVSFSEFATDTDMVSEENHATLFGKILKSIKTLRSGKIDKTSIGQTDTVNDVNKVASTAITYAHGQSISAINNNLARRTIVTKMVCAKYGSEYYCSYSFPIRLPTVPTIVINGYAIDGETAITCITHSLTQDCVQFKLTVSSSGSYNPAFATMNFSY